jgi:hypothetical protein
MTPMDEMPTPDLAVPYAAPMSDESHKGTAKTKAIRGLVQALNDDLGGAADMLQIRKQRLSLLHAYCNCGCFLSNDIRRNSLERNSLTKRTKDCLHCRYSSDQ